MRHLPAAAQPLAGVRIVEISSFVAAARGWLDHEALAAHRPGLIHLEITGRADGSSAVDYTVNAATGFPYVTGPADASAPVNHVLPAWDVACGLYVALAIAAAVRHRDNTGEGSHISLPLENVALATAGNLGFLTEAMVCGTGRPRLGNELYGTYGQTFVSADGVWFMVVTLTGRHFRDLVAVTGTDARSAPGLGADTAAVLREQLGLSSSSISNLRTAGIAATEHTRRNR